MFLLFFILLHVFSYLSTLFIFLHSYVFFILLSNPFNSLNFFNLTLISRVNIPHLSLILSVLLFLKYPTFILPFSLILFLRSLSNLFLSSPAYFLVHPKTHLLHRPHPKFNPLYLSHSPKSLHSTRTPLHSQ